MTSRYSITSVVTIYFGIINGRSSGDIPASICNSMVPEHDELPQTVPPPYAIAVDSAFFVPNVFLRVDLHASPEIGNTFEGYICQARTTASNLTVGEFSTISPHSQGHSCYSDENLSDTVSHTSSWWVNPGSHLVLRWRAPPTLLEAVRIRCTIVENNSTFWIGVESKDIVPIQNTTYDDCCNKDLLIPQCSAICKDITEPANESAVRILEDIIYENGNPMCSQDEARLALRCSYWAQPGYQLEPSVIKDCCKHVGVSSGCMKFCEKNFYASTNYPGSNFTDCTEEHPELLDCVIQPVQGVLEQEHSGSGDSTTMPATSTATASRVQQTQADDSTATSTHMVTATYSKSPSAEQSTSASVIEQTTSFSPESSGRYVFTITTTVDVNGAMENDTLRSYIFGALETDLLIPALAKVPRYESVRTGENYYAGSLIVESEGVYTVGPDGAVASSGDVQSAFYIRLREINDTIRSGSEGWTILRPVPVVHKVINGYCQTVSCAEGETCVEVGQSGTVCSCDGKSCGTSTVNGGLSTGALIGIIVGAVIFIVAIGVIAFVIRRRGCFTAENKRQMSIKSNPSYEEPVYMDISSAKPEPPELPPDRSAGTGNLPSNSVAYETPDNAKKGRVVQSLRKTSEGYVIGITEEKKAQDQKKTGETNYGYATYNVNASKAMKTIDEQDGGYDDHHLKADTELSNDATTDGEKENRRMIKSETQETKPNAGTYQAIPDVDDGTPRTDGKSSQKIDRDENPEAQPSVGKYETLSGYEYAFDSAARL